MRKVPYGAPRARHFSRRGSQAAGSVETFWTSLDSARYGVVAVSRKGRGTVGGGRVGPILFG